jgi:hypothetical protein
MPRPFGVCIAVVLVACGTGEIRLLDGEGDGSASDATASDANDAGTNADGGADVTAADASEEMCGACPCGLTDCGGGSCVDTTSDPNHCGSCQGQPLLHNAYCKNGIPICLPGLISCAGSCIDFASNPDHCGTCNATPCNPGEKCENGVCGTGACTGGRVGCPVSGRTACVDPAAGWPYCEATCSACAPTEMCAAGACHPYGSAAPCTTCPCASDCARVLGDAGVCCPAIGGSGSLLCVTGSACPP